MRALSSSLLVVLLSCVGCGDALTESGEGSGSGVVRAIGTNGEVITRDDGRTDGEVEAARRSAEQDLRCPLGEVRAEEEAEGRFVAEGCGGRAVYLARCNVEGDARVCKMWLLQRGPS